MRHMQLALLTLIIHATYMICGTSPEKSANMAATLHGDLSWEMIKEESLAGFRYIEEEFPDEEYHEFLTRLSQYQLQPNKRKKRRIACDFFAQEGSLSLHHAHIIQPVVWDDLCILKGPRKETRFFAESVAQPHTEAGKVLHYAIIATPTADLTQIRRRQCLLAWLWSHPEVRVELQEICGTIKDAEAGFLSFWNHDGFKNATRRFFFSSPASPFDNAVAACNQSSTALLLKGAANAVHNAMAVATDVTATALLAGYATTRLGFGNALRPLEYLLECGARCVGRADAHYDLNQLARSYRGAPGPLFATLAHHSSHALFQAGIGIMASYYCLSSVKPDAAWARDSLFITQCVAHKEEQFAIVIRELQRIHRLFERYPDLAQLVCDVIAVKTEERMSIGEAEEYEGAERDMLSLLATIYPCRHPALWHGHIMRLFSLIHAHKEFLQMPYQVMAYLDAFSSVATLLTPAQADDDSRLPGYALVNFVIHDQPCIILKEFWNPFLKREVAVTNSIMLGNNTEPRGMIITGSNAGGKSTVAKACILNVILAQSYGIAAARVMLLTPMRHIFTALTIGDDILEGKSRFKAELLRAQSILADVEEYAHMDAKTLVFLDEPFSGTDERAGAEACRRLLSSLGSLATNCTLVTTHHGAVTCLADDMPQAFGNYRAPSRIAPDGTITYPFTLERGVSQESIALHMYDKVVASNT